MNNQTSYPPQVWYTLMAILPTQSWRLVSSAFYGRTYEPVREK